MEILGYLAAIVIGVSLGMIGGGGSILTVPALVYLMGKDPELATAYSLFIVGLTSLVGSINFMRQGLVSYKTSIVFAIPSFIAVYLTRGFVVPAIPEEILTVGGFTLTKGLFIMGFFGLVMLASSYSMIRNGVKKKKAMAVAGNGGSAMPAEPEEAEPRFNMPMIIVEGLVVGTVTGLVGAGGGFLIVPALVLLAKLPMRLAIGSSLLIIAAKSLIGFLGDVQAQAEAIEWSFLGVFSVLAIGGIFLGAYLARFVPSDKLKAGFGWFVLIMAIYILGREFVF
jgi:uncharacterized membrane protein YfcA